MARKVRENVRVARPVFVDLRRELHEITRRVGAGERRVALAGEKTVQRMAKFVEQRDNVIPGNKRRLTGGGLQVITDIVDNRPVAGERGLVDEIAHPGTAAFAVAREESP